MNLWQCTQFDIQTFPWHLIHLTFPCWAKGTLYGPRLRRLKVPRSQQRPNTNGGFTQHNTILRLPYLQSNKSKMLCWFIWVFKILHVNHVTCIQSTISDVRKKTKDHAWNWGSPNLGSTKPSTEPIRPQQGLKAKIRPAESQWRFHCFQTTYIHHTKCFVFQSLRDCGGPHGKDVTLHKLLKSQCFWVSPLTRKNCFNNDWPAERIT